MPLNSTRQDGRIALPERGEENRDSDSGFRIDWWPHQSGFIPTQSDTRAFSTRGDDRIGGDIQKRRRESSRAQPLVLGEMSDSHKKCLQRD